MSDMREAFEKWADKEEMNLEIFPDKGKFYLSCCTHYAWKAWQAARAHESVNRGHSRRWLNTLDRWIDLMSRVQKEPVRQAINQEVQRVKTEVMRYREHRVAPNVVQGDAEPVNLSLPDELDSGGLIDPVNLAYCDGWNDCRKDFLSHGAARIDARPPSAGVPEMRDE